MGYFFHTLLLFISLLYFFVLCKCLREQDTIDETMNKSKVSECFHYYNIIFSRNCQKLERRKYKIYTIYTNFIKRNCFSRGLFYHKERLIIYAVTGMSTLIDFDCENLMNNYSFCV